MGFRNLFKRMAGERPQEVAPVTSPAPAESQPLRPTQVSESPHSELGREPTVFKRPAAPVESQTDSMRQAQMRLAAKRTGRIVVRGIQQYGRDGFSGIFAPGESVSLERDPSNPYDKNAVKVLLSDGSMLGYVAREMAEEISHELAEGWRFTVRIADVPYVDEKWGQCQLDVMDKHIPSPSEPKSAVTRAEDDVQTSFHSNRAFVPPLNFGDSWQQGKISAYTVGGLDWLYAYYPSHNSTSKFRILQESPGLIMDEEIRAAESIKNDSNGNHRLRAMLVAFSIKDSTPRAAEYLRRVGKLKGECAARCVDELLPAISDARTIEFIAQYVDMDSVNACADVCWNVNQAVLVKYTSALETLAALGMRPRLGSYNTLTGRHTDASIMYTSELCSPLSGAVVENDVAEARYLIGYGADINQMMFESGGRGKDAWHLYSSPILMKVRSVEMYKLFVEAGVTLYPRSYTYRGGEKSYGEEHNLLEALWKGQAMDDTAIELADYLVVTEYDMPLRSKIDEIRTSFNREDGGPYKNNKSYVLEWCDMEKRAIAAAIENVNEIAKRDGHKHHSLSWDLGLFIDDWSKSGYEKALHWHAGEFSENETPARYVYPERILKRGVQHGIS